MSRRQRAVKEFSAGGVVARRIEGQIHFLLIKDPYGNWGLPKGHLEEEEGAEEAALREVQEETGLAALTLGPELGSIDWYFRLDGRLIHKFCSFYLMHSLAGDARPEVEEGISDVRWLEIQRAIEEIAYDNARTMVEEAARLVRDESSRLPFDL